jgi:hypothetical protein
VSNLVLHEALLEDHRDDQARSGEADVVELSDGRLLIIYSQFDAQSDHAKAPLVSRTSADGGVTWSEPETFLDVPPGGLNVMSVSLLRLADGRIACVHIDKRALDDCRPRWCFSEDEGRSWSSPRTIVDRPGYYVVNNDRLAQLASGRLLIPYAYSQRVEGCRFPQLGCVVSDDGGETWKLPLTEHTLDPEDNVAPPEPVDPGYAEKAPLLSERRYRIQEPGVVELLDGRLMMYARSDSGYAWRCFSRNGGQTWSRFEPIREFAMPCGPTNIKRLPGTERLVMIYNDRSGVPFGSVEFNWRTPLCVAVSDDDGRSWRRLSRDIESDDGVNYCYASLDFFGGDKAILTYYVGWPTETTDAGPRRRNLKSLKVKIVDQAFFRD